LKTIVLSRQARDTRSENSEKNAVYHHYVGHGTVVFSLFHLGFAYFKSALPPGRPADRGSTDENNNHWVPTNFSTAAREIVASAAGAREQAAGSAEQQPIFASGKKTHLVRHFVLRMIGSPRQARDKHRLARGNSKEMRFLAEPLVEVGLVHAPGLGAVLPLVDWSRNVGSGPTAVNVTLDHKQLGSLGLESFGAVTMASTGAAVASSIDPASGRTVLHVSELVVGDAIIMRAAA
jgi:hypothetical protein